MLFIEREHKMKIKILSSIMIVGVMSCFSQTSFASSSLNIDFGQALLGLPSSYGAAAGQAGNWNEITQTGQAANLLDTSGLATGINLELSNRVVADGFMILDADVLNNPSDDVRLLSDNFFATLDHWSIELSGLDEGSYDIYYYAPGNVSVSPGLFSINGIEASILVGSLSLSQGDSWDVLSDLNIDNSGLLTISSNNKIGFRGLSGLQVVSNIPVPGAVWLFGSALIGMFGMRKKLCKDSSKLPLINDVFE